MRYQPKTASPRRCKYATSQLAARAYSQGSIDAHRWALRQFSAWAAERGAHDPTRFMRSDLEAYQIFLYHYRSPRAGKSLVVNTQLARLGSGSPH